MRTLHKKAFSHQLITVALLALSAFNLAGCGAKTATIFDDKNDNPTNNNSSFDCVPACQDNETCNPKTKSCTVIENDGHCSSKRDCAMSQYCNLDKGTCETPIDFLNQQLCDKNANCDADQECNQTSGLCVDKEQVTCSSDADCKVDNNEKCDTDKKICRNVQCYDNNGCEFGFRCTSYGQCASLNSCMLSSECTGTNEECKSGFCVKKGEVSSGGVKCKTCPTGFKCDQALNGCVPACPNPCGGSCASETEACETGKVCYDGACTDPCADGRDRCSYNGACCLKDEVCVESGCVPQGAGCNLSAKEYCMISSYCDPKTASCIRYDANPELCTYEIPAKFKPRLKLLLYSGSKNTYNGQEENIPLPDHMLALVTPVVGDIDGDGTPDLIVTTAYDDGVEPLLRVISGKVKNENEPWKVAEIWNSQQGSWKNHPTPVFWARPGSSAAIGDVNRDGQTDIIVPTIDESSFNIRLKIINGTDFTQLRESQPFKIGEYGKWSGGVSLSDLDHDGKPEILFYHYVFDNELNILCDLKDHSGNTVTPTYPIGVQLDVTDDKTDNLEIVAQNITFSFKKNGNVATCTPRPYHDDPTNYPTIVPYKYDYRNMAAVADVYKDKNHPGPEIVTVNHGKVTVHDSTGKFIWEVTPKPPVTSCGGVPRHSGGAPTIADFDGDDKLEIGFADCSHYYVFKPGIDKQIATFDTQDNSSGMTGSSVFDFDGDGQAEILYNDENMMRVYNTKNGGSVRFEVPSKTRTITENPIVADVDGDGHADIVVLTDTDYHNNLTEVTDPPLQSSIMMFGGIRVYTDFDNQWVNTRKIWNQHAYHYTNINDDGTVPQYEKPHWKTDWTNNYRQNIQAGNSLLAPNLQIKLEKVYGNTTGTCGGNSNSRLIKYVVTNVGSADVEANPNLKVRIYAKLNSEPSYGNFFHEDTIDVPIPIGGTINKEFTWNVNSKFAGQTFDIKAVVDADNNAVRECIDEVNRKNNNDNFHELTGLTSDAPDISINVPLIDTSKCINSKKIDINYEIVNNAGANISANTVKVKIYAGIKGAAKEIYSGTCSKEIPANGRISEKFTWHIPDNIINKSLEIRVVVDEDNQLPECDETNNSYSTNDDQTTNPVCITGIG